MPCPGFVRHSKWKILLLGLTAAKGALDATLSGYYVGAFGHFRQMAEYWFGIEYLDLKPESAAGFYAAEPGEKQVRLPYIGSRISDVLAALAAGGSQANHGYERFARLVNKTYKRMSDGHHLDGLALVQTGDPNDPGYYLGATFHPSLVKEALYHGTLMTGTLSMTAVTEMAELNLNSDKLITEIGAAMDDAIEQLAPLDASAGVPTSG
jgi:hypothetical protein